MYSVVTYELLDETEGNLVESISTVPTKWINWIERLMFWPPRSMEAIAILKWLAVDRNTWSAYTITKLLLKDQCKDEAYNFLLNYNTDIDDESNLLFNFLTWCCIINSHVFSVFYYFFDTFLSFDQLFR